MNQSTPLLEAAALLTGRVEVVMTGDRPPRGGTPGLRFTGFVPVGEFQSLMAHATVVLALTTREATMQRTAYEGLQLGRPLVCSGTGVLRRVLANAAVVEKYRASHRRWDQRGHDTSRSA